LSKYLLWYIKPILSKVKLTILIMVAHAYKPRYWEGRDMRFIGELSEKQTKRQKGWGHGSNGRAPE
jgi:hypothetical protein